jgi:FixJ family two-component response regulator
MNLLDHMVFVVDDDTRVREALHDLLTSLGSCVVTFGSAAEYREFQKPDLPSCLILDIQLPDVNGLELQRQLSAGRHPPIVFITGYGDIPSSVQAIKAGAVDFLAKPFSQQQLMGAVQAAIEHDRGVRLHDAKLAQWKRRLTGLTPREREVLPLVVSGRLNKQAAAELGISETTLQIHRGRIMRKMKADSLAELVRMAGTLRIPLSDRR